MKFFYWFVDLALVFVIVIIIRQFRLQVIWIMVSLKCFWIAPDSSIDLFVAYPSDAGYNHNIRSAGPLRIVSRMEWLAMPPMRQLTPLQLPSKRVIIAHTGDQTCSTLVFHRKYVSQLKKTTNSKTTSTFYRYHARNMSKRFKDIT